MGSHRAWCYDCEEWCSPAAPCVRCAEPQKDALLNKARNILQELTEVTPTYESKKGELACAYCGHLMPDTITDEDDFESEEEMKCPWVRAKAFVKELDSNA